ncbi:MAG: PH domain-containing protein [Brachybacterium sp.]|uniref:PH domain-containing protein n=1 Tax=Brachybacterium sp. TaxID=1891286 RepID=UPI00264717D7|nr:PH domain-containing protein [Brachybacterium sp.]MDN5685299.1 PH domain-containing protein [Brachybacterium sp.]
MSTPEQHPGSAPPDLAPADSDPSGAAAPDPDPSAPAAPPTPRRRTPPITPLVTGWKIVVGIVAVISAQNIARLVEDFTVTRALIGAGVLVAAIVVAIALSGISWWFMTYAVDDDGVSLHTGMISKSRQYAPRARIESVSVERPLLARVLGLAKVRVELAGGGESYLDIEYIRSADAERLRRRILGIAARPEPAAEGESPSLGGAGAGSEAETGSGDGQPQDEQAERSGTGTLENVLYDGVTDGELIAKIPTGRLVRSLLRDLGFLLGTIMSIVGVGVAIPLALWQDGFSFAVIIALLPTAITIPKYIFGRIESGWGFVSRHTDRGLRMRRGLANTRTDNIASGRIQRFVMRRPLLWRGPAWTAVSVTVSGIDDAGENGAENVLPVGTPDELGATLGHLAVPLGTSDDLGTLEHLLTARARDLEGLRTPVRPFWIARRTEVTVLLPGALIHRSGLLARTVAIIPRERIQGLTLEDDPFGRRLGVLDLSVGVAGDTDERLTGLAREDARALHAVLARDARTLRRYRDREQWPQPALGRQAPGVAEAAAVDRGDSGEGDETAAVRTAAVDTAATAADETGDAPREER